MAGRELVAGTTVAIVGLGLMGGSLGLALRPSGARRVGTDDDRAASARALEVGAVDEVMALDEACAAADLVVIATPVGAIERLVPVAAAAMRPGRVLTDLGSTKARVVAAMDAAAHRHPVQCVGGHPMCGRHTPGIANADARMFAGAPFVIVPTVSSSADALGLVRSMVRHVGSTPVEASAADHDRAAAIASHLPFMSGGALAHTLAAADLPLARVLAASGFRDASRTAGGDPRMWLDILLTNRDAALEALAAMQQELAGLRRLLERGDAEDELAGWLAQARAVRRSLD